MGSAHAIAEWHPLRRVVVRPPGLEAFFGLLEPYTSLYERVFSLSKARREHEELVDTLRSGFGVQVQLLDQLLLQAAGRHPEVGEELLDRVARSIQFSGPGSSRAQREFKETARLLDGDQLISDLILEPPIRFLRVREEAAGPGRSRRTRRWKVPLTNLFFLRDQQAVTDRGIVLGRLAKPQRRRRDREITGFA